MILVTMVNYRYLPAELAYHLLIILCRWLPS